MKNLITLFLIFVIMPNLLAQDFEVDFKKKDREDLNKIRGKSIDLTGIWEGVIIQDDWENKPIFDEDSTIIQIEIQQNANKITGRFMCNAAFAHNLGYISFEKDFVGTFDGQTMSFKDTRVKNYINAHKTRRQLETCLKEADLDFFVEGNYYILEGRWTGDSHRTGSPCAPGTIRWRKPAKVQKIEEIASLEVNFPKMRDRPEIQIKGNKKVKKLKQRKVQDGQTVLVRSRYITVEVYDHKKNDGDIVSINYNGDWILEKHKINHNKHIVDVYIDENAKGPNFLILYAHNLGVIPPNTCAVIVDDGYSRRKFVLNSDLDQSDVLYFEVR